MKDFQFTYDADELLAKAETRTEIYPEKISMKPKMIVKNDACFLARIQDRQLIYIGIMKGKIQYNNILS